MKKDTPSLLLRHRLVWLVPTTLGVLLLLPSTRYLLRTQIQMQALTFPTRTDLRAERAAAGLLPDDYPIQLALATETPTGDAAASSIPVDPMAIPMIRNRRIAALAERFPNNPSVYANLLRYISLRDMLWQREQTISDTTTAANAIYHRPSPELLNMFIAAAQKGAALDSVNAYFPMMEAVGLLADNRDGEAMEAIKTAGRCTQWNEYFADDLEGQNRLQTATYGEQGAVQHILTAANLLFPQYAQLRAAARVTMHLVADDERDGNTTEGIEVRHALMRCGGLMRARGSSYITSLVGIAITAIGAGNPGGVLDMNTHSLPTGQNNGEDAGKLRTERLDRYYAYLEKVGQAPEASWARTEIAAGDRAQAIGSAAISRSVFDSRTLLPLRLSWLANNALLSTALVLLLLGAAAHLAERIRPRKILALWRFAYALVLVAGIGVWQWQASQVGMSPFFQIQAMWSNLSGSEKMNVLAIQQFAAALGMLIPTLLIGMIAAISTFHRVPLATALGRGLRGTAIPAAGLLFLVYGASLLPTAHFESVIKTDIARVAQSEPQQFAEVTGKVWPGDPQP